MYQTSYPIRLICFIGILSTILFTSCGTRAPRYDYRELAQAAIRLDMDIAMEDNHRLYIESSQWIGVPYRAGGNTKRGVDCSGLTYNIYKKVYHKHLKRNSDEQRKTNCRKISKNKLQEGDLVFFHNGKNKRTATHVGIYLKNDRFIHASTSRGVIVSRLDEPYYRRVWMQGGRVKGL
ncbi:C40 family peptidase [Phocaeicola sp. HCN-6420]|jgi:lipoprotein Spr|uniref:C40 family peptidase n=3 Tax=unclassified Phocaeicola TaxID=2762211 RepID=UPI0030BFA990